MSKKQRLMLNLQLFNGSATKEELLEFLKKQPEGAKFVATVEAMETAYRTEIERKTQDNKSLRTKLTDTEKTLKTVQANYSKVMTHFGIDEGTEDLDGDLEKASKFKGENSEWQRKYDILNKKYQKEIAEKDIAFTTERGKRHDLLKTNAVLAGLTGKVHNPQEISKLLLASIKIGEDDSLQFVGADGKETNVEEGIKAWLGANTWAAVNPQNPGGGSNGGGGGVGAGGKGDFGKQLAQETSKFSADQSKAQATYFG